MDANIFIFKFIVIVLCVNGAFVKCLSSLADVNQFYSSLFAIVAFYNTIVAKQLYRKVSFYSILYNTQN